MPKQIMNAINITQERPDSREARVLIEELETYLAALYPVEARYGLSVARLLEEQVAFFVMRVDGLPTGCGGVKFYGKAYAELKRMYVRPDYQGQGLGQMILAHLEDHARSLGIPIMRLETGIYQEAAIRLYERMGYRQRPSFGDYRAGDLNLFYEKALAGHPAEEQLDHGDE
jgi:GNAT superfamily N-acetyltransferase